MRITVLHRGTPIGVADLSVEPPFAFGRLEPLPSYETLRPVFQEEARALRNCGFLPPDGGAVGGVDAEGDAAGKAAVARAAAVCRELELRDAAGAVVAMESIGVSDWYDRSEIELHGFLSDDHTGAAARIRPAPRGDANAESVVH
jgi:hypothetical protein